MNMPDNNIPMEEETQEISNNLEKVLNASDPIIPPEKFDWANKWLKGTK